MLWTTTYTPTGVDVRFQGRIGSKDIYDANEEFYAHSYADRLRWALIDFTAVTEINVTSAEVKMLADQDIRHSKNHPGITAAIIAPQTSVFGLARMWEVFVSETGMQSMVYQTRDEALIWLSKQGINCK
jgi:hypothetical protein